MAKYFNYFPKTYYSLQDKIVGLDIITNIVSRFTLESNFLDNSSIFLKYDVQESDTPEIIADKLYGSPEKHWIVLAANQMIDPQFDWPLEYRTFNEYVRNKYQTNANTSIGQTGLEWAKASIHSYYEVETRTSASGTEYQKKVEIDANTYANVASTTTNVLLKDKSVVTIKITKETKTYYDYEFEENENKRSIQLIKPEFAFELENELKKTFSE
jgi:hypothetical protein